MDQQIINNNKLIAEFMSNDTIELLIPFEYELGEELPTSGEICTPDNVENEVRLEIEQGVVTGGNVMLTMPNYHTDWNWLMPVIKKITNTHFNSKSIDSMKDYGRHLFLIQNELSSVDIKKTHDEVVKWITWYNKKGK